jgi:hypothetical protein
MKTNSYINFLKIFFVYINIFICSRKKQRNHHSNHTKQKQENTKGFLGL